MKTALEKFEWIKTSIAAETNSLTNDNLEGTNNEETVNKILYQATDKILREKLSEEENGRLDRINEVKEVCDALKEWVGSGRMTTAELATVLASKEFNDYAKIE